MQQTKKLSKALSECVEWELVGGGAHIHMHQSAPQKYDEASHLILSHFFFACSRFQRELDGVEVEDFRIAPGQFSDSSVDAVFNLLKDYSASFSTQDKIVTKWALV